MHDQLELVDSMPAIGRDGALSRRRIVASAECAHEPLLKGGIDPNYHSPLNGVDAGVLPPNSTRPR